MTTLEAFATDLNELDAVLETTIITHETTKYAQINWQENPGKHATDIHNIHTQYDSITQVVASEPLREHNPDHAEYTQYFTTTN